MLTSNGASTIEKLPSALNVKLTADWQKAYAGESLLVTFDLTRPTSDDPPVRLLTVRSNDLDVCLDTDMMQEGVEIRPGERYCFVAPLRVLVPKVVDLSKIEIVLSTNGIISRQSLDARKLSIKPSLKQEIDIRADALFEHKGSYKVLLTLTHRGATTFRDFAISFPVELAVSSGKKTTQRTEFPPGNHELIELVVNQLDLDLAMSATIGTQRAEWSETLKIKPPISRESKRFRYLEQRGLAQDDVKISNCDGEKDEPTPRQHSTYIVRAGSKYRITIKPKQSNVKAVTLMNLEPHRQIPTNAKVRDSAWSFEVEVVAPNLLRRRDQFYYEILTDKDEKLTGEIPTCVVQTSVRFWQAAAALGLATTVQGFTAFARFIRDFDASPLKVASETDWNNPLKASLLLSIPLAWVGLKCFDWVQYQFRK
ncbi:MAG: hypothetical protein K8T89_23260 [Planctomycetes bacterium]|nr:hypothetical protein [Planctomycetota bacterium]